MVAIESIDFKLPPREIAHIVKQISDEFEQAHDLSVVEELVILYNRKGMAVLEQQGVEAALS